MTDALIEDSQTVQIPDGSQPYSRLCGRCGLPIPPRRLRRANGHFCCRECADADRRDRRNWMATRTCRLCGRAASRPRSRKHDAVAVPDGHDATGGSS